MACARLPGFIQPKRTLCAAERASKNKIACGITILVLFCSNTLILYGLAPLNASRLLRSSMIYCLKIGARSDRLCVIVSGFLDAFVTAFNLRRTQRGLGLIFKELMYHRIKMMTALRPALAHTFQTVCLGYNPDQRRPEAFWLPKPKRVLHVGNLPRYN